jgi:hypothetical protein
MDLIKQDERIWTDWAAMWTNGRLFEHGNELSGSIICREFSI